MSLAYDTGAPQEYATRTEIHYMLHVPYAPSRELFVRASWKCISSTKRFRSTLLRRERYSAKDQTYLSEALLCR